MLRFVTTNDGKVREASEYLGSVTSVEQVAFDYEELQSDSLEEIAIHGVTESFRALDGAEGVFVEDSGLFIEVVDGFPGPYSSYVYSTLGIERVWSLVSGESDRDAVFRSVVAFTDGTDTVTFEGVVHGTIVAPRGDGGFGYDPIFEYDGRTFAELTTEEKNAVSHRGRALAKFASWVAGEPATHKGAK